LAALVVRFAAALLPLPSRDRYREQWLGDLRDAPALGIRASEIAFGSLAFAATLARPMPDKIEIPVEMLARLSRGAVALSLSSAIVAVSQYAGVATEPTNSGALGFPIFGASALLTAYAVLAPTVAFVTVMALRRIASKVRIAVGLLALASMLPVVQAAISDRNPSEIANYFTSENSVYPAATLLVVLAVVALWREYRPVQRSPRLRRPSSRLIASVSGGLIVALSVTLGFADTIALWASRTPLVFGYALSNSNRLAFEEWVTLKVRFEDMVSTMLGAWALIGIATALAVAAFGFFRNSTVRRSIALSFGALCAILVSYGGLLIVLEQATPSISPTVPVDLVMLVGRWGLVAVVVVVVGRAPVRDNFTAVSRAKGEVA
jgi:hypothetical protein